jgi:5'-3' exonuclease
MKIYLVDGTYELFRNHFGAPPRKGPDGREVGATLGLLRSLLLLLATPGITHVACAFDHVIESFRNDLYPGYKTGAGVDPSLLAQFELCEEAVAALGLVVWSMVEFEADDALASATARFKHEAEVEQIVICSPDKDLAQLVSGSRIVGWDRRRNLLIDEAGVVEKFGVRPQSIPDWLGLVGDAADGFPGLPGWGEKSAAAVLAQYEHLEAIPAPRAWPRAWSSTGLRRCCSADLRPCARMCHSWKRWLICNGRVQTRGSTRSATGWAMTSSPGGFRGGARDEGGSANGKCPTK